MCQSRNVCPKIYSWDVDGLFCIGLSWILGGVSVHGDAAGFFEASLGFEPNCSAQRNLEAAFSSEKMRVIITQTRQGCNFPVCLW